MNQKKNNVGTTILLISLFSIGILLYSMYRSSGSPIDRLFIAFIFFTSFVPVTFTIFVTWSVNKLKSTSNNNYSMPPIRDKYTANREVREEIVVNNAKDYSNSKKPIKTNPSPYYEETKNLIISCSKNRLFNREDVVELKNQIDDLLGTHATVYSNFQYSNDYQEIYTKLKSRKLTDDDYLVLLDFIRNIVEGDELVNE